MNRKALEQKDHVKYLGVLMDQHLTWSYQISSVAKKISRGIGILARLRTFLDPKLLISIYYCLVYSHLSYGIHAWGSAAATDLNKIEILQKKAVRILTGSQYFQIYGEVAGPLPASEPLFKRLEILKLNDIFKLNIANFVYATLSNESPPIFSDWFTYTNSVHAYSTTSSTVVNCREYFDVGTVEQTHTLFIQRPHLEKYGKRMIQVSGPILWNSLPRSLQESPSLPTFKSHLKKHFLGQYNDPN